MQAARQRCEALIFERSFIRHLRLFGGFDDLSDQAGQSAESLGTCFGVELLAPLHRRGRFEKRQGSLRRSGRFVNRQGPLHQNSPHRPLALAEESGNGPGERRRSKSVNGASLRSPGPDPDVEGSSTACVAFQSVQLAGTSERLPAGSTTSSSRVPRRLTVLISCNERPSNGCRSRWIVTEPERLRRWVVCDAFLRHGPSPAAYQMRAATSAGWAVC